MDYNSTKNQEIKGKFVARDVYSNVNSMVEYILNAATEAAPFTFDDITNMYAYPEYTGQHISFYTGSASDYEEAKEELEKEIEALEEVENPTEEQEEKLERMQEELDEFEDLEQEPQEIYEWWIVSSWLAEKLIEKGEPVIESENIWGRTTTGQAILLDSVISEICSDMEILEGQKNEW